MSNLAQLALGLMLFVLGTISSLTSNESNSMFVAMMVVGTYVMGTSWRKLQAAAAPAASEVLSSDTRPPVLYLRAWSRDSRYQAGAGGIRTLEQQLADVMLSIGPPICIANPDSEEVFAGFARLAVAPHQTWQEVVVGIASQAALVVFVLDPMRGGLEWEVSTIPRVRGSRPILFLFHAPVAGPTGRIPSSWMATRDSLIARVLGFSPLIPPSALGLLMCGGRVYWVEGSNLYPNDVAHAVRRFFAAEPAKSIFG